MNVDLAWGYAHFLCAFGLVALLTAEWVMVRPELIDRFLPTIGKVDGAYGLLSVLLLIAGFGRVFFGDKDSSFYFQNPNFWLKIGLYGAVAIASLPPTFAFIRWRRAAKASSDYRVPADAIRFVRLCFHIEAALLVALILFAGIMARGIGL
jgi:putative membrane protein